jgi:hypothetical protein
MHRKLGLSREAVCRIGKSLKAQAYVRDPETEDFLVPSGASGLSTDDIDMRVTQLEQEVGELQTNVQTLQQVPSAVEPPPAAQPVPQAPQWQPTSWWDRFKQVVMPDLVPGAPQPGPNKGDPSLGPYSNTYVGSRKRR